MCFRSNFCPKKLLRLSQVLSMHCVPAMLLRFPGVWHGAAKILSWCVTGRWSRMLWSSYALGTRTLSWFGNGCSGHRMLLEHARYYGLGTDALVIVCSWNTNVIMVWARMLWSSYALRARTISWFGHGCSGHRMLSEHERYHGLGTDALVTVCSSNRNVIMVWAWMLWSSYALGTQTLSWFGHGCSGRSSYALGARTLLWFGHGCSGHRMLLEQKRYHGLRTDALVIVCSWNTNVIMVWAWMLWSSYALGTRTLLWFGHGCSGHRMLLEHARHYGLGSNCSGHRMLLEHERYYGHGMVWPWTKSKYVYCLNQSTSHRTQVNPKILK